MNVRITILLMLAAALVMSACSFLIDFDPEGQPCGDEGECLEGYTCVDGFCRSGQEPGFDCTQCASGGCLPGREECVPNTCEFKVCAAGERCEEASDAGPQCVPVPETDLGAACTEDSSCAAHGANRVCLRGAVQDEASGGATREGICVELCVDNACSTPGAICRIFQLGLGAGATSVCLPSDTLTPCAQDAQCERGGAICTVFDHPDAGALTACDRPLESGVAAGDACVVSRDGGEDGALCANGLCVPTTATPDGPMTCGEPCEEGTCSVGVCELFELDLVGAVRKVPLCIDAPSACRPCDGTSDACTPNAPHCVNVGGEGRCLASCTPADPDAGTDLACPTDYACTGDTDAGFYCVPESGSCL